MLLWDWSLCSLGELGLAADSNLRSVLIALNTFCTLELILSGLLSKLITDMNSCSRREWTISSLKDLFSGSTLRVRKVECFLDSRLSEFGQPTSFTSVSTVTN